MPSTEPNGKREEPREGLSPGAIIGLIVVSLIIILGGLCVFLAYGG
jgi:hypothetical protein